MTMPETADLPRLSLSTVGSLPPQVHVPSYLGRKLTTGIVHFGVGNFHRSHQAMYIDRLLEAGLGDDWAICGVGLFDKRMAEVLESQDGLYTLTLRHPEGDDEFRVIGSIRRFLHAPDDPQAVIEQLADPAVRIVSLTITEGGYVHNAASGTLPEHNAQVLEEVASGLSRPLTVFGYIIAGLLLRRERGLPPFAVLSCDNIQGNGHITRLSVVGVARLVDAELADWIDTEVSFPSTMVDRITPVTRDEDVGRVATEIGVSDGWPVTSEPFTQWILEDHFPAGRPPLDTVGAVFAKDIEAYEAVKLRLLNGPHQAIAYIGQLLGHTYAHETMQDTRVRDFVFRYMHSDSIPSFTAPNGLNVSEYCETVLERFANPTVRDPLARLSVDGSDRIPIFVLPVVQDTVASGRVPRLGTALLATWCSYWMAAVDGSIDPSSDVASESLRNAAIAAQSDPALFLTSVPSLAALASHTEFVEIFVANVNQLRSEGPAAFLESL